MSELTELFERDPLSLTKDDPALITAIKAYREMRHKYNLGDMKAGTVKAKAPKEVPGLDVNDLDLKI